MAVLCLILSAGLLACQKGGGDSAQTLDTADLIDGDGDGFAAASDCDDARPAVNPSAAERCDDLDNDCDGAIDEADAIDGVTWFADGDGDGFGTPTYTRAACEAPEGFIADHDDCDDLDASVNPDGAELCDGLDNDCDGVTDEDSAADAATWYADSDGDGYGNPVWTTLACEPPEGFIADSADCDDSRAEVNPGQLEACDEGALDEDCDGLWDSDDIDVVGAFRNYPDGDGDGYGLWVGYVEACEVLTGYAALGGDCDDADGSAYPTASEVCGDVIDNDCDEEIDEEEAHALDWFTDGDADGYGDPASPLGTSCDVPDGASSTGTDCDDGDPLTHPGAAEIYYDGIDEDCAGGDDDDADLDGDRAVSEGGEDCDDEDDETWGGAPEVCGDAEDNDCDGAIDTCGLDAAVSGGVGDALGGSVAWAEDLNLDGHADAVIGAAHDDAGGRGSGTLYVVFGPIAADATSTGADAALTGLDVDGYAGAATLSPGDLDGDGYPELATGAPGVDRAGEDAGALYLIEGPVRGRDPLDVSGHELLGEASGDEAGAALATAGDIDGDGLPDLLVGGPGFGGVGAAWLVPGDVEGDDLTWAWGRWEGASEGGRAGAAVAVGDLDGDGLPDLCVGAPLGGLDEGLGGLVYAALDPAAGGGALDDAELGWRGATGAGWGRALAWVGDTDGDGLGELLIGGEGAAALVGYNSGWIDVGEAGAVFEGGGDLGAAVAGTGDLDGDGLMDLAVGAPGADEGASDGGAVRVWLGPVAGALTLDDADAVVLGASVNGGLGAAVAGGVDGDGDGRADLLIGAPGTSGGAGAAAVLYGGW